MNKSFIDEIKEAFPDYEDNETTKIAKRLMSYFGGQQLYVPLRLNTSNRDQNIYADFKGNNIKELCRKYCLSEKHIYKIIRQQRLSLEASKPKKTYDLRG